jgi:uncharacterized membrane protein
VSLAPAPEWRRGAAAASGPVALLVLATNLVVGLLRSSSCLSLVGSPFGQPGPYCVSDVRNLYDLRGLAGHALPYLHVSRFSLPKGTVEYPVLTSYFAWLVALPTHDGAAFWLLDMFVMAVIAAAVTTTLARVAAWRALLFAGAPAIALYSFHNWDLLPLAATVAGILAWRRGSTVWASVWFGVGACLKVYPALLVIPLYVAERRKHERPRAALVAVAPAAAVALVTNTPFLIWGRGAWEQTLGYQSGRGMDGSAMSLWSQFLSGMPLPLINASSLLVVALGVAVICFLAAREAEDTGAYNVVGAAGALVASFIAFSKVSSPQCALWLLPFLVLLNVRVRWWLAFVIVDLACYAAVFAWVDGWHSHGGSVTPTPWMGVAIVARTVLLLALGPVLVYARPVWERPLEPASFATRGDDEISDHVPVGS